MNGDELLARGIQLFNSRRYFECHEVWEELWNELHHQGDVGDASFASVPFLVRSYRQRDVINWNTYALVAIIELAIKTGRAGRPTSDTTIIPAN